MMKKKNWSGFLRATKIQHVDIDGKILWENSNVYNVVHKSGHEFVLKALFGGEPLPDGYYLGLDARSSITEEDVLTTASATEPSSFGYTRQGFNPAASNIVFFNNVWIVKTPAVTFTAVGGTLPLVSNLFLGTTNDDTGFLISTIKMGSSVSIANGQNLVLGLDFMLESI